MAGDYPQEKVIIVGGGIIGLLEAYFAFLAAKQKDSKLRITVFEKNAALNDTTVCHLVPSLAPDEIFFLVNQLVSLVNTEAAHSDVDSSSEAQRFKQAVQMPSLDESEVVARQSILLDVGKESMVLWKKLYETADAELKSIMTASHFNPCYEGHEADLKIEKGYRCDLFYDAPSCLAKANHLIQNYQQMGYGKARILSPSEVSTLYPHLIDFCNSRSHLSEAGEREWDEGNLAVWRPGGCIATQIFIPKFYDYLREKMGKYINEAGIEKDCFRLKFNRKVTGLSIFEGQERRVAGLQFFDNSAVHTNKHDYLKTSYVFCPGESAGTLKKLGLKEPVSARFAGASLILSLPLSKYGMIKREHFFHYMEVFQENRGVAWQAHLEGEHLRIGVGGTMAFYADVIPHVDHPFAKKSHLIQLNIINTIFPYIFKAVLGKTTENTPLDQADLDTLEANGLIKRWVGSRTSAFDGFPTVGRAYDQAGYPLLNSRVTTHLGSGGVSNAPAAVFFSKQCENPSVEPLAASVLNFGSAGR